MSLIFRGGGVQGKDVCNYVVGCVWMGGQAQDKYHLCVVCVEGVSFLFCGFVEH